MSIILLKLTFSCHYNLFSYFWSVQSDKSHRAETLQLSERQWEEVGLQEWSEDW